MGGVTNCEQPPVDYWIIEREYSTYKKSFDCLGPNRIFVNIHAHNRVASVTIVPTPHRATIDDLIQIDLLTH